MLERDQMGELAAQIENYNLQDPTIRLGLLPDDEAARAEAAYVLMRAFLDKKDFSYVNWLPDDLLADMYPNGQLNEASKGFRAMCLLTKAELQAFQQSGSFILTGHMDSTMVGVAVRTPLPPQDHSNHGAQIADVMGQTIYGESGWHQLGAAEDQLDQIIELLMIEGDLEGRSIRNDLVASIEPGKGFYRGVSQVVEQAFPGYFFLQDSSNHATNGLLFKRQGYRTLVKVEYGDTTAAMADLSPEHNEGTPHITHILGKWATGNS